VRRPAGKGKSKAWHLLSAGLLALAIALPGTALAKVRLMRVFDWRSGLPVSFIGNVEQDPDGFLWVTTSGGLYRFDGTEMVATTFPGTGLVTGSPTAGMVFGFVEGDDGIQVLDASGKPIPVPDGASARPLWAHMTPDGALWTVHARFVRRRSREGVWGPLLRLPGDNPVISGGTGRGNTLLVKGSLGGYRVHPSGRVDVVAKLRGIVAILDRADGSTALGTFVQGRGFVYEAREGVVREIDRHPTRFMGLAERAGALWIAYDDTLARLAPGEPRETIANADGLPSGGVLLVDREGSLWVASFRGLVQFPEPETVSWDREVPAMGRHVLLDGDSVWMSTWRGLFRARRDADGWTLERAPSGDVGAPCLDVQGDLWTVLNGGFAVIPRRGPVRSIALPDVFGGEKCATSGDGGLWFPTTAGLYLLEPGASRPRCALSAADGPATFAFVHEDAKGSLWGSNEQTVCRASAREVRERGRAAAWECVPMPHRASMYWAETEAGTLWTSASGTGVLRLKDGAWEQIPGSRALRSQWTTGMARSPRGGIWITGEGNFLRVRERPELPQGWEVLETIGSWQGLPTSGVMDVVEDGEGNLWAATNLSLVRVPPIARAARPSPPPVVLVEASVDGHALDVAPGRVLRLPRHQNRLELRFAALSYRDPSLVRYRSRLNPEEPWSLPTRRPYFRFVDLPPRRYHVEVEASLDGARWSAARPAVSFEVLPAWYATWWFRGLVVATIAALLLLAYRLRVASLLRSERQRMRIAMDLHDEVGSGLGSIGVLAGILARPELPETQRADLSGRIGGVARELASSLGDIVWSLRTGSGTLDALWAKILDRGRPLFAGGSPALRVEAPDPIPLTPLSLVVRRNVSLIAIEALHNAARHAAATAVVLTLRRDGDGWIVSVEDDGSGLRELSGDVTRRGLGLTGMRLRAEEMGGTIAWETPDGGGTRVVIRFHPGRFD
jgi:signal transduction histidine kinase/ligand-binding sensor domain-containing protein